jgi:hypothetical protein
LQDELSNLQRDRVIVLEVRGPAEQVRNAVQNTEGVVRVTPISHDGEDQTDGIAAFEIRTVDERDLREAISQRVTKQGWTIRRLDIRRRTLEEHFVRVTMGGREE